MHEAFGALYVAYLSIAILSATVVLAVLWAWMRFVRPEWVGVSLVALQVCVLMMVAGRLWQRAAQCAWNESRSETMAAPEIARPLSWGEAMAWAVRGFKRS